MLRASDPSRRFLPAWELKSSPALIACGLLITIIWLPNRAWAASKLDPQEVLDQLHNAKLDPDQIYVLRHAQLTRDRVKLFFTRGYIGFFTKAGGVITGAVFTGEGEILLIPPTEAEKQSLARFIHSPILEEQFSTAILRFTDQTAQELIAVGQKPEPDDPERPLDFPQRWNSSPRVFALEDSPRIFEDLLGNSAAPFFHARLEGNTLKWFDVVDNERDPEALSVIAPGRNGDELFADTWCAFPTKTSETRFAHQEPGTLKALAYHIDTHIEPDNSMKGCAELLLESLSSSDRVVTLDFSRLLKISKVLNERGESLPMYSYPQQDDVEGGDRTKGWIQVVLPAPHPVGERFRLRFNYQGNVITDVGNNVLYVGERGGWYPNLGLGSPASFDLEFDYPDNLTLVATGARIEGKTVNGRKYSRWRSDGVFRVAGFNLGPYHSVERRVGKTSVEVYATREAEAALEQRHAQRSVPRFMFPHNTRDHDTPLSIAPDTVPPLAPAALLQNVADSASQALEYFESLFGPFPYSRLAISQIPGNFGQGWPELVYLPTLSFLRKSERYDLGLPEKTEDLLSHGMVAHEIAHQWWGNLLGWKTYHDQWLSEGLATYAAALDLSREKDGVRRFHQLLRGYKLDLLSKGKSGMINESSGPIWLGQRLSNSLTPGGYDTIVYKKACWVLHMLRGLMRDPSTGSDEKFFRLLHDFVATNQGKSVSTEDFIRAAEKYMTRTSDLEHNRRLDWFFNEWVYETGIPTYQLESSVKELSAKRFLVQGTITQSGVSSDFEMLVPVTAEMGKEKKASLGRVVVSEDGGRFKFTTALRPKRVAIDEDNLLAISKP
jgi:hypothetical protein